MSGRHQPQPEVVVLRQVTVSPATNFRQSIGAQGDRRVEQRALDEQRLCRVHWSADVNVLSHKSQKSRFMVSAFCERSRRFLRTFRRCSFEIFECVLSAERVKKYLPHGTHWYVPTDVTSASLPMKLCSD